MDIDYLKEKVKEKLSPRRYKHTCGVEKICMVLAEKNNCDIEKARVAAILHDYMKEIKIDILKEMCKDVEEVKGYENLTEILHGFAGAKAIEEEFGIKDKDILNAVKYHTIGREGMSMLEKIVYIGDAIEEGRNYPGVDKIREETLKDINLGIITEVERKINYLNEKGGIIHVSTLNMRDDLLRKEGDD